MTHYAQNLDRLNDGFATGFTRVTRVEASGGPA
jgi:hypothetical protein